MAKSPRELNAFSARGVAWHQGLRPVGHVWRYCRSLVVRLEVAVCPAERDRASTSSVLVPYVS